MSIETLLTLGLAAGLLAAAALLRLIVLGLLSVGLRLAGRDRSWLHPARVASGEPRTSRQTRPRSARAPVTTRTEAPSGRGSAPELASKRPVMRDAAAGIGGAVSTAAARIRPLLARLGSGGMLVLATIATWIRSGARAMARGAAWLGPRVAERTAEFGAATAAGLRWLGPRIVLAAATTQHLIASAFAGLRSSYEAWSESRQTQETLPRPAEPEAHNVIHLDRQWDPLDPNWDPLTDDWPEDSVSRL